jgi:hypothetical protein
VAGSGEALGPLHRAAHGPPPRAGEDWDAALAAFRGAADAVAGEEKARAGASFEEAEAGQERYDRLCGAMEEALLALLGCPAPDVAALGLKLELADAHEVWTMSGGEGVLAG